MLDNRFKFLRGIGQGWLRSFPQNQKFYCSSNLFFLTRLRLLYCYTRMYY